MTCTLSLGPDSTLSLRTPSGRELLIPVSPHSTPLLWQILWNSSQERRQVAGRHYATEFPQQAIIDAWAKDVMPERLAEREREAREAREAKAQQTADRYGFDLKEIDI